MPLKVMFFIRCLFVSNLPMHFLFHIEDLVSDYTLSFSNTLYHLSSTSIFCWSMSQITKDCISSTASSILKSSFLFMPSKSWLIGLAWWSDSCCLQLKSYEYVWCNKQTKQLRKSHSRLMDLTFIPSAKRDRIQSPEIKLLVSLFVACISLQKCWEWSVLFTIGLVSKFVSSMTRC